MREATRVILHDSAVDIATGDDGANEFPVKRWRLSPELENWLRWLTGNTFTKRIPEDAHVYQLYEEPDFKPIRILAEVTAPHLLELAVTYADQDGEEFTDHATYCGSFEVWWKPANE